MVTVKVDKAVTLKIPSGFVVMSTSDRINKFVSSKTPLAMYNSMDREINLGVNTNPMEWIDGDEAIIKGFYKASFEVFFDEIEYLQDTIKEINGKKYIVFEFISSLKEENVFATKKFTKNYAYIQYTSYNGQILLFNFGCGARRMNQWRDIAREIMDSIRIKE